MLIKYAIIITLSRLLRQRRRPHPDHRRYPRLAHPAQDSPARCHRLPDHRQPRARPARCRH